MFKSYLSGRAYGVLLVVMIAIGYLLWFTHQSSREIRLLNQQWREHGALVLEKQTLLHEMKTKLGYTGFIHNFKNYVIRRDEVYLSSARNQLNSGLFLIEQYKKLKMMPQEQMSLAEFENVILDYADKVTSLNHAAVKGWSVAELDNKVRVDDTPALAALGRINVSIVEEFQRVKSRTESLINSSELRISILAYVGIPMLILISLYLAALMLQSTRLSRNLNALIQVMPDGFLVCDQDGKIVLSNYRLFELFGYSKFELDHMIVEDLMAGDAAEKHKKLRYDFIATPQIRKLGHKSSDLQGRHKNGEIIPVEIAISSIQITTKKYGIAIIRDRRKEIELIAKSEVDFLTGVYNRMGVQRLFIKEIDRNRRYKCHLSLIVIDIDYFKEINDDLGHLAGDSVITVIADVLKKNSRPSDIVGRWGGDEFCVICPETKAIEALEFANRVRKKVKELRALAPLLNGKVITLSIGISEMTMAKHENTESIFSRADAALYQAKEDGRDKALIN